MKDLDNIYTYHKPSALQSMKYDMTFCVSPTCPYIDHCDRSAKMLEGQQGIFSFADFSGTCRDYIAYVVDQIGQGVSGDG